MFCCPQEPAFDMMVSKKVGSTVSSCIGWFSNEIAGHDCYVAFFGKAFPTGAPDQKPYVLRYASASLAVVREAPD